MSLPIATTTQSLGSSSNILPAVPNNLNNNNVSKGTFGQTAPNSISSTCFTIQPIHQRTRSLPLTEETVIQLTSLNSNPSPRSSRDSIYSKNNKSSNDHQHHPNNNHTQNTKSSSSMSISSNPNTHPNESTVSCNQMSMDNSRTSCTCTIENHDNHHQTIPTLLTTTVENTVKNDDINNSVIHSVTFYNNIDAYGSHNDKSPAFKNIFNNKMFMGGGFIQSSYIGGLPLALQRGRSGNNCVRSMYFIKNNFFFWFCIFFLLFCLCCGLIFLFFFVLLNLSFYFSTNSSLTIPLSFSSTFDNKTLHLSLNNK